MGILYVPPEKEIIGPWILSLAELEELDTIIEFIDSKLKESQEIEFQTEAEEDVKNERYKTVEEALEKGFKYSFKKEKKKNIVLISEDETRLTDESLKNILIDTKIKAFKPKELDITVEYGYSNIFNLTVRRRFDGDLKYKIKCFDNDIENQINYKIENWVEKNQPNRVKRIWNKYSFLFLMFSAMICFFSLINIYKVENPKAIDIYKSDIEEILKNGITNENQVKAIELMLKVNTNYLPANVEPIETINGTLIKVSVIAFILVLIFWKKPKTTIGVGKHKNLITFYNWYVKIVLITIPTIFFLPPIIEFIKSWFT